ncbi:PB1 domain-containing protein [Heracleum sosnowskyi]|uniref:PB1 domain-containing protein n=1 Tax=Heracleum sosnowskyi TaxID=360622 RepID=A0AAD8MJC0_9APIA|nr:PB1 domain-containing protein [Heracleum sosnowskyi]
MSYKGGEAYAVDLDKQSQLSQFKQELAEMFQYNVDSMLVKYFLPGNRNTLITISREKDLQRMVNFYEDSGQVEVFILYKEGAARDVVNTSIIRYLQSDTFLIILCNACIQTNPVFWKRQIQRYDHMKVAFTGKIHIHTNVASPYYK